MESHHRGLRHVTMAQIHKHGLNFKMIVSTQKFTVIKIAQRHFPSSDITCCSMCILRKAIIVKPTSGVFFLTVFDKHDNN